MLTCVYHPIDHFRVVQEDEAERLMATGVWFDSPTKAKQYRLKVEDEIKEEDKAKKLAEEETKAKEAEAKEEVVEQPVQEEAVVEEPEVLESEVEKPKAKSKGKSNER